MNSEISISYKERVERAGQVLINFLLPNKNNSDFISILKLLERKLNLIIAYETAIQKNQNHQLGREFQSPFLKMTAKERRELIIDVVDQYVLLSTLIITSSKRAYNVTYISKEKEVNRIAGKFRQLLNIAVNTKFSLKPWLSIRMFSDISFANNLYSKEEPFKNQDLSKFVIHPCHKSGLNYLYTTGQNFICGVCAFQNRPFSSWEEYYREELAMMGVESLSIIINYGGVPSILILEFLFETIIPAGESDRFFEKCLQDFWDKDTVFQNLFKMQSY